MRKAAPERTRRGDKLSGRHRETAVKTLRDAVGVLALMHTGSVMRRGSGQICRQICHRARNDAVCRHMLLQLNLHVYCANLILKDQFRPKT